MIFSEEEETRELTEEELDALYFYLDMNFEDMSEEEKATWIKIMERIDKEFYENKDSGII